MVLTLWTFVWPGAMLVIAEMEVRARRTVMVTAMILLLVPHINYELIFNKYIFVLKEILKFDFHGKLNVMDLLDRR